MALIMEQAGVCGASGAPGRGAGLSEPPLSPRPGSALSASPGPGDEGGKDVPILLPRLTQA